MFDNNMRRDLCHKLCFLACFEKVYLIGTRLDVDTNLFVTAERRQDQKLLNVQKNIT